MPVLELVGVLVGPAEERARRRRSSRAVSRRGTGRVSVSRVPSPSRGSSVVDPAGTAGRGVPGDGPARLEHGDDVAGRPDHGPRRLTPRYHCPSRSPPRLSGTIRTSSGLHSGIRPKSVSTCQTRSGVAPDHDLGAQLTVGAGGSAGRSCQPLLDGAEDLGVVEQREVVGVGDVQEVGVGEQPQRAPGRGGRACRTSRSPSSRPSGLRARAQGRRDQAVAHVRQRRQLGQAALQVADARGPVLEDPAEAGDLRARGPAAASRG